MSVPSVDPPIIGGVFGLAQAGAHSAGCPFLTPADARLANGRSAIWLLLRTLKPARVWLPSFLCPSILEALPGADSQLRFFGVSETLQAETGWLADVDSGDLVVLIDYFGWRTEATLAAAARERGAVVLEDASQALLTQGVGSGADYVLFSPRKTVGVPDGGVLSARSGALPSMPLEAAPAAWWHTALEARRLRARFDADGGSRSWFELYQQSEEHAPVGPFAMSDLTVNLLNSAFDYAAIAAVRRANYVTLLEHLQPVAVLPELPPTVVPLGFPMRVPDRLSLLNHLYARGIYPPVHWSIAGVVPDSFESSHRLSREILTLPCDQRYAERDMRRMARHVREWQATRR